MHPRPFLLALIALLLLPAVALAQDNDGDGVPAGQDCDDNDAANYPGNAEACDGQDNDCNGAADFGSGGGVSDTWTQSTSGGGISNGDFTKGNMLSANQAATVTSFGMELNVSSGVSVTLTIAEGSSTTGSFTVLASVPLGTVPGGQQLHTANGLNVSLSPGNVYFFGATWSGGSATNYYDTGGASSNPGWGTFQTGAWTSSGTPPTNGWSAGDTPSGAYSMQIVTGAPATQTEFDVDGDGSWSCLDCDDNDPANFPGNPEICDGQDNDCNGLADFGGAGGGSPSTWTQSISGGDISNPDFTKGNILTASSAATVTSWGMELDVGSGVSVTLTIAEASSTNGPYTVLSSTALGTVPAGQQVHDVSGLNVPLTPGMTYFFGATWSGGSATNYYGSGASTNPSWGSFVTGAWTNSGTAPTNGWTPGSTPGGAYSMEITTGGGATEGSDGDGDGVTNCTDCDDANVTVYPGAPELCDGLDNDCDGTVPANESDGDGDGVSGCTDCDDANAAVYPGATELCNGIDDDCDPTTFAAGETDGDGDGFAGCAGDCDDNDPNTYPGAAETCDGIDNNCDGSIPASETVDSDGDTWVSCLDCDDQNAAIWPGASELCDGFDSNCDGVLPQDEADADGDTWMECEGDCDDAAAAVNPDAFENCFDGIDNNCDGLVDGQDPACNQGDDDDATGDDDDATGDDDDATGDDDNATGDDDDATGDDDDATGDDDDSGDDDDDDSAGDDDDTTGFGDDDDDDTAPRTELGCSCTTGGGSTGLLGLLLLLAATLPRRRR